MRERGYTLVELLVVIAIIAIIAAMIAPVLLQAKEAARMHGCAENMRQLGAAISHYIDDNNGYSIPQLPRMDKCANLPRNYKNPWILCIEPLLPSYVPNTVESVIKELPLYDVSTGQFDYPHKLRANIVPKRLWICPGDIIRGSTDKEENTPFWYYCGSSYMYPGAGAYAGGDTEWAVINPAKTKPRQPGMWRNPKRDILLADYWIDFHSGKRVPHKFDEGSLTPPAVADLARMKNINMIFLDMHMSAVTSGEKDRYRQNTLVDDNPFAVKKESKTTP